MCYLELVIWNLELVTWITNHIIPGVSRIGDQCESSALVPCARECHSNKFSLPVTLMCPGQAIITPSPGSASSRATGQTFLCPVSARPRPPTKCKSKPEPKPGSKPEPEPEPQSEHKPEPKRKPAPEPKPELKPQSIPESFGFGFMFGFGFKFRFGFGLGFGFTFVFGFCLVSGSGSG